MHICYSLRSRACTAASIGAFLLVAIVAPSLCRAALRTLPAPAGQQQPIRPSSLGVYSGSAWYLDRNDNRVLDAVTESAVWGSSADLPVVGDWNADGFDELGVFSGGAWFIDRNGDGGFDPATDAKGWGVAGWTPMPGDWNGDGVTELGVVSPSSVWFRDLNGDFAFDPATEIVGWGSPGDTPVVADWNGDGADEIAVYSGGIWFIDYNGDGAFDPATEIKGWGVAGWTPLPGDWNGDGITDLGVVSPDSVWFRDLNADFAFDPATEVIGWGAAGDIPLAADWNGDGRADLGVFSAGVWFVDLNGDGSWQAANEAIAGFGQAGQTPVVGRWGQAPGGPVEFFPAPGSQGAPYSTRVIVSLADAVNPVTVNAGSVQVLENGAGVGAQRFVSVDRSFISVRAALKPSTDYLVIVSGLLTADGRAIPEASSAFRTGAEAVSVHEPVYDLSRLRSGLAPELPVRFTLSYPLDPATVEPGAFVLDNLVSGKRTPLDCVLRGGFRTVVCPTDVPLAVGTQFRVSSQGVETVHGQVLYSSADFEFTVGFDPDQGQAPDVLRITPPNGADRVNPRSRIQVYFDEPVEAGGPAPKIRLTRDGVPVEVAVSYYSDDQSLLDVAPRTGYPLTNGATYALTVDEVYDASGRGLANPGISSTFTVAEDGPSPPSPYLSVRPLGAGLPLNPVFFADLNQAANPATVNADSVRITGPGGQAVALDVALESPTLLRISPQSPLSPDAAYEIAIGPGLLDTYGQAFSRTDTFTTADFVDETAPRVLSVNPPDGAQDVAEPHQVVVHFSERVVAPAQGIRLERANGDVVAWREGGYTPLRLVEDGRLDPGQQYRIVIEGAADLAGNPLPLFQSTFTTASAGTAKDTIRPTIVGSNPAHDATDISLTPTITIELSEPVDPTTVQYLSLVSSLEAPADFTLLPDGRTLRIAPSEPLLPGRRYFVVLNNLTDLAGNHCSCILRFTTVPGLEDTTPPSILSVTPEDGSVIQIDGIGVLDVNVVFSEPIENFTLRPNVFAVVNGVETYADVRLLGDGASARISLSLHGVESDAEATIILDGDILDLYGNPLGAEFRHHLSLRGSPEPTPQQVRHEIVDVRPRHMARSVSANALVTLIAGVPISTLGLAESFLVSENGVLKDGAIRLRANDQIIEFVPTTPFAPGALVQVFLRRALQSRDSQHPVNVGYWSSPRYFHVAGGTEPFEVLATTPSQINDGRPVTTRPSLLLSAPALPSSVTPSTVTLHGPNGPVAGALNLRAGGKVIEFQPDQNLEPGGAYGFTVNGVQSLSGQQLPAGGLSGFWTSSSADVTPPTIAAVSPADGSAEVPLNARIRLGFSESMPALFQKSDLRLEALGQVREIDSVEAGFQSSRAVTFIPREALQPDTLYTVTFAGATDPSGLSTGPRTWSFRTAGAVDTVAPAEQPDSQQTRLTSSSVVMLDFAEPVDLVDFVGVHLWSNHSPGPQTVVTGTWSASMGGKTVVFAPDRPLPVGSSLQVGLQYVSDLVGNQGQFQRYFSVDLLADTTPPVIETSSISDGETNVTPFLRILLTTSEAINPRTVNGSTIRLFDGATPLPVFAEVERTHPTDQARNRIFVGCACALDLARTYRLEVSGVTDVAGNAITPYQLTFTTRGVYEFRAPRFTFNLSGQPLMFRTVEAKIRSDEPLNPATVNAQTVFYRVDEQPWPSVVTLDADRATIRLAPVQALPANAQITIVVTTGVQDLAGNPPPREELFGFRTGEAEFDTEPPVVSMVQPPDGSTGVPVNTIVFVRFSEDLDRFLPYPSYRLLAPGGVEVSTGDGPLLPNTTYTIDVPAEGADFAGLPFAGAQFTFTTAASAVPDVTRPSLISSTPAPDAVDVPVDTMTLGLVFDEPVLLTFASVSVFNGYAGPAAPIELVQGADPAQATIQILEQLAPDTAYRVQVAGYDRASNQIEPGQSYFDFHTSADSPDTDGPRVLTVNPPDGATDVAVAAAVIEFDGPLQSSTVNESSISMFADGVLLPASVSYAGYGSTVRIGAQYGATAESLITVAVSSHLLDLAGNPAEPFVTRFRLGPRDTPAPEPMISVVRPDTGRQRVAADSSFHLFLTEAVDPASAQAATLASEDGVLISGAVNVASNNQVLTFTPDRPYADGATVRLFVDLRLLRLESGDPFGGYLWETWFGVGSEPFGLISGDLGNQRPRNTRLLLRFSEPLNSATVSDQTFSMVQWPGPVPVPVSVQLDPDGRQVRITPQQTLAADGNYQIDIGDAVRSESGAGMSSPGTAYFRTNAADAVVAPMAKISPLDGVTGVGVNGSIVLVLGSGVDRATVNEQTLSWTDGTTVFRPSMMQFVQSSEPAGLVAVVTPEEPFAASTAYTVTLAGAEDLAGNPVPTAVSTFTTDTGPDFTAPRLLRWSPRDSLAPRNSVITLEFDEPIDPLSIVLRGGTAGGPSPSVSQLISDGGRTVTLIPDELLVAGVGYGVDVQSAARDLSGNFLAHSTQTVGFEATDEVSAPPLSVESVLPNDGSANVPIDSGILIRFDREIRFSSLDPAQIRIEQGGAPVPIRMSVVGRGDTLELIPVRLFDPVTPYVWTVAGVMDLAGNSLAGPQSGGFTTGPEADTDGPGLVSITPADGATDVARSVTWVLVFDQPIDLARSSVGFYPYFTSAYQSSLSADGKTWTVSRDDSLPAQTEIQIQARPVGLNGRRATFYATATTWN